MEIKIKMKETKEEGEKEKKRENEERKPKRKEGKTYPSQESCHIWLCTVHTSHGQAACFTR